MVRARLAAYLFKSSVRAIDSKFGNSDWVITWLYHPLDKICRNSALYGLFVGETTELARNAHCTHHLSVRPGELASYFTEQGTGTASLLGCRSRLCSTTGWATSLRASAGFGSAASNGCRGRGLTAARKKARQKTHEKQSQETITTAIKIGRALFIPPHFCLAFWNAPCPFNQKPAAAS